MSGRKKGFVRRRREEIGNVFNTGQRKRILEEVFRHVEHGSAINYSKLLKTKRFAEFAERKFKTLVQHEVSEYKRRRLASIRIHERVVALRDEKNQLLERYNAEKEEFQRLRMQFDSTQSQAEQRTGPTTLHADVADALDVEVEKAAKQVKVVDELQQLVAYEIQARRDVTKQLEVYQQRITMLENVEKKSDEIRAELARARESANELTEKVQELTRKHLESEEKLRGERMKANKAMTATEMARWKADEAAREANLLRQEADREARDVVRLRMERNEALRHAEEVRNKLVHAHRLLDAGPTFEARVRKLAMQILQRSQEDPCRPELPEAKKIVIAEYADVVVQKHPRVKRRDVKHNVSLIFDKFWDRRNKLSHEASYREHAVCEGYLASAERTHQVLDELEKAIKGEVVQFSVSFTTVC